MIHLPPLPGYPGFQSMSQVVNKAFIGLKRLTIAGFDGALVENTDSPGFVTAPKQIKDSIKLVVEKLVRHSQIPVGMEIIYDMPATIEIACAVSAQFVRLDVFVDDVETRWGKIMSEARRIQNLRDRLDKNLVMLTDIHVKHAKLISKKTVIESATDAKRYGSDGIIITGNWSGIEPDINDIICVKRELKNDLPVLVGSGLNVNNAKKLLSAADGAIVGKSIKSETFIDRTKASKLLDRVREISCKSQ